MLNIFLSHGLSKIRILKHRTVQRGTTCSVLVGGPRFFISGFEHVVLHALVSDDQKVCTTFEFRFYDKYVDV